MNLNFTPPPPFTPLLQHNTFTTTLATVKAIERSIISNKETIEEKLIIFFIVMEFIQANTKKDRFTCPISCGKY